MSASSITIYVSILIFRINTAETVSAALRCKALVLLTADLDHAVSQPSEGPDGRRMLSFGIDSYSKIKNYDH